MLTVLPRRLLVFDWTFPPAVPDLRRARVVRVGREVLNCRRKVGRRQGRADRVNFEASATRARAGGRAIRSYVCLRNPP